MRDGGPRGCCRMAASSWMLRDTCHSLSLTDSETAISRLEMWPDLPRSGRPRSFIADGRLWHVNCLSGSVGLSYLIPCETLQACFGRQKLHQCRLMNFTGFKTEELWTPSKSCLMWLVINSCGTLYWDFVNFVIWPLAISCWSWGHMTDWTLFCFGVIFRLNVINTIPVEIISFIQQRGIMSFRIITVAIEIISFIHHLRVFRRLESQYPLLFFLNLSVHAERLIIALKVMRPSLELLGSNTAKSSTLDCIISVLQSVRQKPSQCVSAKATSATWQSDYLKWMLS